MMFLFNLMLVVYMFLGVFFVTLLERKVLGLMQIRKGPNKSFFKGYIQALSDAIKLMTKSVGIFILVSLMEYNFLPLGMMGVMMLLWMSISSKMVFYMNSVLLILCLFSLSIYPIMFGGWFSGSMYTMLGAIRSVSQMISYEVSLIIIVVSMSFYMESFSLSDYTEYINWGFFMNLLMLMMLLSSILVELNRTPIDLVEGESELVSGFNTEYYGLKFAMIFLAEYGMIMFMGGFLSVLLGMNSYSGMWCMMTIFLIILVIWIRGILPRIRYDSLMIICWVSVLGYSLGNLMINLGVTMVFKMYWGMNDNSKFYFYSMFSKHMLISSSLSGVYLNMNYILLGYMYCFNKFYLFMNKILSCQFING